MHDNQTKFQPQPAPYPANPDERQFQAFSREPTDASGESREGPLTRMDAISLPMMQYFQQAGSR